MEAPAQDLRLLEPPSPEALLPDHGWLPWIIAAAAAAVLLAAALVLLWKRRQPAPPGAAAIRKAACDEAAAALQRVTAADVRQTAVLCSLILRKFLATAAADPALYETHEEFIARQDSLQALTPDARAAAATGFARLAALKYAPVPASVEIPDVVASSRELLVTLYQGFAP